MNEKLVRNVVLVGHKVYALDEITDEAAAAADAIVSIDDPEEPVPSEVSPSNKRCLVLRFFDYDHEDDRSPQLGHARDLIALAAETRPGEKVLVHCYAGISRSTAALAIIFAVIHPELSYDEIFEAIYLIRPITWPNTRLVAYADQILKCGGQFSAALSRFRRAAPQSDD
jgi:predicted protein tyrosine phosphatase